MARDGLDPATAVVAERHGAQLVSLERPTSANAARNAGIAAAHERAHRADRRRHRRARRLAGRAPVRSGSEPRPRRVRGTDPRAPGRRRASGLRARATADHHPRPRARATGTSIGSGGRTWPSGAGRSSAWAASTRPCTATATRRSGSTATWPAAAGSATWPPRDSSTGARARTPRWVRWRGPPTTRAEPARRLDVRVGTSRSMLRELRIMAGCGWHLVRRRCLYAVVMGARAAGAIRQAAHRRHRPAPAGERRGLPVGHERPGVRDPGHDPGAGPRCRG